MGLFSNKKNLCPICGESTPKLFPTKIEGEAICKECAAKIDLPNGTEGMSISDFEQYIACYDENQSNRDRFKATYTYGGEGFFGSGLAIDEANGLFKVKKGKGTFVFDAADLVSFKITEDSRSIFEGDANGLRIIESDVERRLAEVEPMIANHNAEFRQWEMWENMQRIHDKLDDDKSNDYDYLDNRHMRPSFYGNRPIDKFHVHFTMKHPYWKNYSEEFVTPGFDTDRPSTMDYRNQYAKDYDEFRQFAEKLIVLINPAAPVSQVASSAPVYTNAPAAAPAAAPVQAAAPQVDAVNEIQRFKSLLDAGIITEEEFAAKKRQLMGI